MKKIIFLLLIISDAMLYAKPLTQGCFYGQSYEFDDSLLIPSQIYVQVINKVKIKEFLFHTSLDETVILSDQAPALYAFENNDSFYKKILNEESISKHKFVKKIEKNKILILEYENISDTKNKLLFVLNKSNNKYLGSIETIRSKGMEDSIVRNLRLIDNKKCSKENLWNEYEKLSYMDINQRVKILFSLSSLDQSDNKVKEKIIDIMNKKKKLLDLAISNIQEAP